MRNFNFVLEIQNSKTKCGDTLFNLTVSQIVAGTYKGESF
jgi:hypothetical protein